MRGIIGFLFFLAVCTLAILFFAQNDQNVTLSFFVGQMELSLAFIMVGFLVMGYLLGIVSVSPSMLKRKLQIKSLERKLEQKSKEVDNLRALPIRDDY